ncbi:MAG: hypothetical protein ACU0GG_01030 [Paracoccaceae bacterium]
MRWFALTALLVLPACEDPQLGVGATISNSGVSVSPVASGRVGGVGVAISP